MGMTTGSAVNMCALEGGGGVCVYACLLFLLAFSCISSVATRYAVTSGLLGGGVLGLFNDRMTLAFTCLPRHHAAKRQARGRTHAHRHCVVEA